MKLPAARTRPAPRATPIPQAPEQQAEAQTQAGVGVRPSASQLMSATGGVPLPGPVLQRMQRAFGTGFGRVKVHRGSEAEAFDAAAFTTKERIFLPKNAPDLSSREGQALLSHELTHVLQQRSGRVRVKGGGVSVDPQPHLEHEAEAAGHAVMRGDAPVVGSHAAGNATVTAGAPVQRVKEEDEGIELQPLGRHGAADAHDDEAAPADEEKPAAPTEAKQAPKQAPHEGDTKAPAAAHAEKKEAAEDKPEDKPEGGEAKEKPKESRLMRGVKAVAGLFADPGTGSNQPSLQQTDQQVMQNLGGSAELAKQAEASGSAYPPAPDPVVDWAQPQPSDPSAPPPLQIPDRPQPEQPASIQPDPPLAPSGGIQSREFGGSEEEKATSKEKSGTTKPSTDKAAAAS